jgi:hypothetical protein
MKAIANFFYGTRSVPTTRHNEEFVDLYIDQDYVSYNLA